MIDVDGNEYFVDVLVMATGFQPASYLSSLEIVGVGGRTIHEAWAGEPRALLGMTVPGFPNFFIQYGPNTNGGEIVSLLERQAEHVVALRQASHAYRFDRDRGPSQVLRCLQPLDRPPDARHGVGGLEQLLQGTHRTHRDAVAVRAASVRRSGQDPGPALRADQSGGRFPPAGQRRLIRVDARTLHHLRRGQRSRADLDDRLARIRWPLDPGNEDWRYGTNRAWLEELVDYWRNGYDWRVHEAAMNRFEHYRVVLDEVPIHYIHRRGVGPDPMPLVLTHGWPWTFWDFAETIDALADPGEPRRRPGGRVRCRRPSLPGYGFSVPLLRTGVTVRTTAALWVRLMQEVLGYEQVRRTWR